MTENEKIAIGRYAVEQFLNTMVHSDLRQDELMHYGRKGMKWYQHIFGAIDPRAKYKAHKEKKQAEKEAKIKAAERAKKLENWAPKKEDLPPFKSEKEAQEALNRRIDEEKQLFEEGGWPSNADESFGKTFTGTITAWAQGYKSYGDWKENDRSMDNIPEFLKDFYEKENEAYYEKEDRIEEYRKTKEYRDREEALKVANEKIETAYKRGYTKATRDKLHEEASKARAALYKKEHELRDNFLKKRDQLLKEATDSFIKELGYSPTEKAREYLELELYYATKYVSYPEDFEEKPSK